MKPSVIKRLMMSTLLLLLATTTIGAETITLTSETTNVTLQDGDVLTGTGGTGTHVTIADGATVTLNNVAIDATGNYWSGISGAGNATIILVGTNTIHGGNQYSGIYIPSGYTLTIQGNGSLTATGDQSGAGIGSSYGNTSGNIVIEGGTITATGGNYAAGIGCGNQATCGSITINGGTVTANGGTDAAGIGCGQSSSICGGIVISPNVTSLTLTTSGGGNAIGKGRNYYGDCYVGSITIAGTNTGTIHQSCLVYPAESSYYTIHFDKNNDNVTGTMPDQQIISNTLQTLSACTFTYDEYHTFGGWKNNGYNYHDGQNIYNPGNITLYATWNLISYSITYFDAVDGENCVTNTNPKRYTHESSNITLTDPVRPGYTFDGWTFEGQDIPTKTVTIPRGSSGNKSFTAHWSFNPTATITTTTREAVLVDGHTLTGTGGSKTHVTITDGATVTLNGVDITNMSTQWAGITCLGDATIILEGDNAVKGGNNSSGIFVPFGKTLTIRGDGSLTAIGKNVVGVHNAAGIGGNHNTDCGNIVIEGGTITATGGHYAAGIGSGQNGSCGNITISGGTVTATGGSNAAGIGSGYACSSTTTVKASCGNITITGGTVIATGNKNAAGIGCGIGDSHQGDIDYSTCGDITIARTVMSVTVTKGEKAQYSIGVSNDNSICGTVTIGGATGFISESPFTYAPNGNINSTIHFDANGGTGTMDDWLFTWDGKEHTIPACTFTAPEGKIFVGWNTEADGSGTYYLVGKQIVDIFDVTLYALWKPQMESVINDALTLYDGQTLTGTGGSETHVTIADGATVSLNDVDITGIFNSSSQWAGITCLGDATIILKGENTIEGGYRSAGIFVPCDKTLTIRGDGSLTATGQNYSAGIGGGEESRCGNIVIEGGTITATGGSSGAGIGGGNEGRCGNIIIKGGTITAKGGSSGAGIGGGEEGRCGNIVIEGGTITATSGSSAAAIGSGGDSSEKPASCGDITITRMVISVTATKRTKDPYCIGKGGHNGVCGTVTIGGVIGPISESPYTYAPNGSLNSTIHFDNNGGTGTMDDWLFTWDGKEQTIPACSFTAPEGTIFANWNTAADGSGTSYEVGQKIIDILSVTLYAQWRPMTESVINDVMILRDSQTLTGTGDTKTHVTIADGATVTLNDVDITTISNTASYKWAGITCLGDATIILKGENTIEGGYRSPGIFVPKDHTLTICGDGTLTTTGRNNSAGIGGNDETPCGNIVIEGGTITATGGNYAAGIGSGRGASCDNITIIGGSITANVSSGASAAIGCGYASSSKPSSCGNITITNGVTRVIATKTNDNVHIIGTSSKYSTCGTITIAPDLIDVLSNENKTCTLYPGLVLYDTEENTTSIENSADRDVHDVQLRGRTFYKDGDWNTLCLPFAVSNFAGTPLEGGIVKELQTTSNLDNGTLTLNFSTVTSIEAGKPYIVKWESGSDIDNPVFINVTIDKTNRNVAFTGGTFKGNYAPLEITDANRNDILLLAAGNKLGYAKTDRTIANGKALGACRAYFEIPADGGSQAVRQFELDFDAEEETTGIVSTTDGTDLTDKAGAIYDLQGRRIEHPKKGLYIVNERKVVIK